MSQGHILILCCSLFRNGEQVLQSMLPAPYVVSSLQNDECIFIFIELVFHPRVNKVPEFLMLDCLHQKGESLEIFQVQMLSSDNEK